jgi:hypothetical protein
VTKYLPDGTDVGYRAVRWAPGAIAVTELGDIGTDPSGFTYNYANAINSAGTIAGQSRKYDAAGQDSGNRAVKWVDGGPAVTELQQLEFNAAGAANSYVNDIDSAGFIVGSAVRYSEPNPMLRSRAVLWYPDGHIVDLNSLVPPGAGWWILLRACAISDTGWISGIGYFDPDGPARPVARYQRLFLMQIPEPATLILLGLAAATVRQRGGSESGSRPCFSTQQAGQRSRRRWRR